MAIKLASELGKVLLKLLGRKSRRIYSGLAPSVRATRSPRAADLLEGPDLEVTSVTLPDSSIHDP